MDLQATENTESRFVAYVEGLVGVIGASYLVELFIAPPDWSAVMVHTVVPRLDDSDAVLLAVIRDMTGQRRVISVRETGSFPEPVIATAQSELQAFGSGLEFHLYLLGASSSERAAAVADLEIAQA